VACRHGNDTTDNMERERVSMTGRNLYEWMKPLIEAGLVPAKATRVIIDIPTAGLVRLYWTTIDSRILEQANLGQALIAGGLNDTNVFEIVVKRRGHEIAIAEDS